MLKQLSFALLMITLFSIALIGFATNFATDNSAAIDLSDDPQIVSLNTNLESNATSIRSGSEDTYQSIVESSIDEGETTPSGGQFAILPQNYLKSVLNIAKVSYTKIFGTGSGFGIFLAGFVGFMGLLLGFAVWKAWIGRMPD